MTSTNLSFPQSEPILYETLPAQIGALSLRRATTDDLPFLRRLYRQTRDDELAAAGWPEAQREAFCNGQFDLQHMHYTREFPKADFLTIWEDDKRAGRLYVDGAGNKVHIIDISLEAAKRRTGLGSALIGDLKARAVAANKPVTLHVLMTNARARRLYERLGFTAMFAPEGMHIGMRWQGTSGGEHGR